MFVIVFFVFLNLSLCLVLDLCSYVFGSDLHIALDEIERSAGHVSETIAENTAGNIGGVEGQQVHLDLAELARHWNDEVPGQRRDTVVGAC